MLKEDKINADKVGNLALLDHRSSSSDSAKQSCSLNIKGTRRNVMEANNEPAVGISVPTFNRIDLLERCVASLMELDYSNFIVRITDNASSDGTEDFCRDLASRDDRFRYFRGDKNIGSVSNFAWGRQLSNEPYFMWLGDDDWVEPEFLKVCLRRLEEKRELVLVSGVVNYERADGTKFQGIPLTGNSADPRSRFIEMLSTVIDAGGYYGVYRRSAVKNIPIIVTWGSDYLYLCETAYNGPVETISSINCYRNDNTKDYPIADMMRSAQMPAQQAENPYGAIAALFFWRILCGDVYKVMDWEERLRFATRCVNIICSRWTVLEQPSLNELVGQIFPNLDIPSESRRIRKYLAQEVLSIGKNGAPSADVTDLAELVRNVSKLLLDDISL